MSSRSQGGGTQQRDDNTSAAESPPGLIDIRIRGERAFALAVILTTALSVTTFLLIDGIKLSTWDARALSDQDKTRLLDRYNSYSGSIASVAFVPFQQFVAILLPVFLLCFMTRTVLSDRKSLLEQWGPVLGVVVVSWVLSQGLTAVNVQFDSPRVELVISVSDLGILSANSTFSLVMDSVTSTSQAAGNPSTDTLLRSAIHSTSRSFDSQCKEDGGIISAQPEASIRFGFPMNACEDLSAQSVDASALPGADTNKTAVLFSYGLYTASVQLRSTNVSSVDEVYDDIKASDPATLLANMQAKIRNISTDMQSLNLATLWANVSAPEIAIEFSNTRLSDQILFEAVTFTLPISMQTMKDWLRSDDPTATADLDMVLNTNSYCNDHACILQTPVYDGTLQDQVRLLRLCMASDDSSADEDLLAFSISGACPHTSKNSVLVYSMARHIEVEEVTYSGMDLTLTNPRKVYKITVGRLSWTTDDLARVYGAQCAVGANCQGLYVPLSDVQQHLVLGNDHIPSPHSLAFPVMFDVWEVLVLANTQSATDTQSDILYPPNYLQNAVWSDLSGFNCTYEASDYINDIMYRHLYSRDPLQVAYTAGMFWLFQNGAVKNVETMETVASKAAAVVPLAFDGNKIWISTRVSIPLTSACVTFTGCALVLVVGMLMIVWSSNQERQSGLSSHLSVHSVAEFLLATKQYPPFLIHTAVHPDKMQSATREEQDRGDGSASIHEFIIAELRLQGPSTSPYQDIVIGSDLFSRNASLTQNSVGSI